MSKTPKTEDTVFAAFDATKVTDQVRDFAARRQHGFDFAAEQGRDQRGKEQQECRGREVGVERAGHECGGADDGECEEHSRTDLDAILTRHGAALTGS